MFASVMPTTAEAGTESALAALVGGHALIRPPTAPGTAGTGEPSAPKKPDDVRGMVKNQDFIIWSLVFAGILLVAAVIFVFFDRWRKKPTGESARDLSMSLNSFRELYENGEITEAEYERIKAKWAAKLREKTGVPAAALPAPPPPPPPPEATAV